MRGGGPCQGEGAGGGCSFTATTMYSFSACKFEVRACRYLRQKLVITSAERKSVIVIASCRVLASVTESEVHKRGPSLQMLSKQVTVNR